MPRRPSHDSEEGRRLFAALKAAQHRVEQAEHNRDDLARDAAERGLSAHSLGAALKIDPATAWRKYARKPRHRVVVYTGRAGREITKNVGMFTSYSAALAWCKREGLGIEPVDGQWAAILGQEDA